MDITNYIESAIFHENDWKNNHFLKTLELLSGLDYEISFWEHEENWALVLKDSIVIGYIWQKYPLAFFVISFNI